MLAKLAHRFRVWRSLRREAKKEKSRSPHWSSVRAKYLKDFPVCEACGSAEHVQVHHVKPFHIMPDLELDPANFIALCMSIWECHDRLGHGSDWKAWNPDVRRQALGFKFMNEAQRLLVHQYAKDNRRYSV